MIFSFICILQSQQPHDSLNSFDISPKLFSGSFVLPYPLGFLFLFSATISEHNSATST